MLDLPGSLLKQTASMVMRQLGWEQPSYMQRQAQLFQKLEGKTLQCAKKGMDTLNRLSAAHKPPDRLERRELTLLCKIACVASQPQTVLGRLLLLPRKLLQTADAAPQRVVGNGCRVAQLLLALAVFEEVVGFDAATAAAAAFYASTVFPLPVLTLVDELGAGGDAYGVWEEVGFAADVASAAAVAAAPQGWGVGAGLGEVGLQPEAGLWLGYDMSMWVGLGRWQQKKEQEEYDQMGTLTREAYDPLGTCNYDCSANGRSGSSMDEGSSSRGTVGCTGQGTGGVLSGGRAGLAGTGGPMGWEEGVGIRRGPAVAAPPPTWWVTVCRAWWAWWAGWYKWVWS